MVPGTHAPRGFKFFHFHAVLGKIFEKIIRFRELAHPLRKILDPPLFIKIPFPYHAGNIYMYGGLFQIIHYCYALVNVQEFFKIKK